MAERPSEFVDIEFLRATRPEESDNVYDVGDIVSTNEQSAARWVRRGAAKIIESTAPAKPKAKAKARKKKDTE